MKVVLLYSLFAVLAMAANILAQEAALLVYGAAYAMAFAILSGTAVGLVA